MQRRYVTPQGLKKHRQRIAILEERLRHLESQTAEAAEVGGNQWHDNASYEQLVIDIRGVDHQLTTAHKILREMVIATEPSGDCVAIGTYVKIDFDGDIEEWQIGGHGESDPQNGIIAYDTPLASLLIGKPVGEAVTGQIAERNVTIKILELITKET